MKVSVLHMEIRNTLEDNLIAAKTAVLKAAKQNPSIIALPEYFTVPNCMADFTNAKKISEETCAKTLDFLQKISQTIDDVYLLGGTVLEEDSDKYYNTSTLWRSGKLLAKYKKISPIRAELEAGVAKGSIPIVIDTEFGKLGMIVCADTFNPEVVTKVAALGVGNRFVARGCNGNPPDSSRPSSNCRNRTELRFLHPKSRQCMFKHEGRPKRHHCTLGSHWRSHGLTRRLHFECRSRHASSKRLPSTTQ